MTTTNPAQKGKKSPLGWLLAIVVIIALIAAGWVVWSTLSGGQSTSSANTGDPKTDLAVCADGVIPDAAKVTNDKFITNSIDTNKQKWSDSVSTPYTGKTTEDMVKETLSENGGNPTFLLMNVQALSAIKIDSAGTTIGDINPCFGDFIKKATENWKTWSADFIASGKVSADVTDTAQRVNTLLLRLKATDIVNENSLTNWHIAAKDGLNTSLMPVATLNNTEEQNLPVLRFAYTFKTGCEAFAIGFNTGDKRFETLAINDCQTPPSQNCSQNCGGGGCTTNCGSVDVCININGVQTSVPAGWAGGYGPNGNECHEKKINGNDVTPVQGANQQPNDPLETYPTLKPSESPAPVVPSNQALTSTTTAPGANNGTKPNAPVATNPGTGATQAPSDSSPGTAITNPDN